MSSLYSFSALGALSLFPLVAHGAPIHLSSRQAYVPEREMTSTGNETTNAAAFAADPSIDVKAIYDAAVAAKRQPLAEYQRGIDDSTMIPIYGDWLNLIDTPVVHFIGDMDTDCDGVDHACDGGSSGNTDTSSQPQTSWGHLSATRVPFYVLPMEFTIPSLGGPPAPNALGAIICNGKMYYGIFGDQNGNQPQLIGEASLLLGQTCFPEEGLSGAVGHNDIDVAYIVFAQEVPEELQDTSKDVVDIDIAALKKLGDENAMKLQAALSGAAGGAPGESTLSLSALDGTSTSTLAAPIPSESESLDVDDTYSSPPFVPETSPAVETEPVGPDSTYSSLPEESTAVETSPSFEEDDQF